MFFLKSFVDLAFYQTIYLDFGMQNKIYHNFCLTFLKIKPWKTEFFVISL